MQLLPKNEDLFVHLRGHARLADEAAELLHRVCTERADREQASQRCAELQKRGKEVMRQLTRGLRDTFITPLDRNDLHRLGKRLGDILSGLTSAVWRMQVYALDELSAAACQLSETQRSAVGAVNTAIERLSDKHQRKRAVESCAAISDHATAADRQLREALSELLARDGGAAELIKRKDIYEQLEAVTAHCEAVSETIVDILLDE